MKFDKIKAETEISKCCDLIKLILYVSGIKLLKMV